MNVIVMGGGKSGICASVLLAAKQEDVLLYDQNEALDVAGVEQEIKSQQKEGDKAVRICTGSLPEKERQKAELLVMSPGIPVDTEFVESFRKDGIPVIGEIELAYRYAKGRLIAITGTNGKTTTTALTGHIMEDWYKNTGRKGKVFVVGNIGTPYTEVALETTEDDTVVLEVSSFQLETIKDFHPQISAILNITPDHLNRHHTMEAYAGCKLDITKNQTAQEVCVHNTDEQTMNYLSERRDIRCCLKGFSAFHSLEGDLALDGDDIVECGSGEHYLDIHEMKLLGSHNVENVMAAIRMAEAAGVPKEMIVSSVKTFTAVEHRIEYVATVDGVDYYNDSKGTNPDAAIKGIQAMNRRTVLIGGGYDKQSTYDEWIDSFDGKVSLLILLGQTREKIESCAHAHGFTDTVLVESMEEAVKLAHDKAKTGEAVLLSPACASWGMFKNYEERGRIFKELVRSLADES